MQLYKAQKVSFVVLQFIFSIRCVQILPLSETFFPSRSMHGRSPRLLETQSVLEASVRTNRITGPLQLSQATSEAT